MTFDLSKALSSIAPTLASMLLGPLAGAAVAELESAFGLAPGAGVTGVGQAMQSGQMTPEIIATVRAADQRHAEAMGQQSIDVLKINSDQEAALAAVDAVDRDSARRANTARDIAWWLAIAVLATFAVVMAGVLVGCYQLVTGGVAIKDAGLLAAVAGLVGSVVGYVAGNASTVIQFIYGGSRGSDKKTEAMADAIRQAIGSMGK